MTVCVVALSHVPSDPRPRRQADLLHRHGVEVTAVGYPGPPTDVDWPYVEVAQPPWAAKEKVAHAARLLATRVAGAVGRRRRVAELAYWRQPGVRDLFAAVREVDADLYVCHGLYALPVIARVAQERGARYAYDSEEFYVGQHADRLAWRLLWPPYAAALQRRYLPGAAWVTTVSEGFADQLQRDCSLAVRPAVVRSVPDTADAPPVRTPGETWTVLFHGALRPDRNVHGIIESVPMWDKRLRLEIRGDGDPSYVASLVELSRRLGVADRVDVQPPVPFAQVVSAAATADIGVIPWPLDLPQKRLTLSNKLFEYLAAGLAVVQVAPCESSEIVDHYGAGRGYAPARPEVLADVLNSVSHDDLLRWRSGARKAAVELSWEREQDVLWSLYRDDPAVRSTR
jgi:glycosyltransferase involved in cell wall biosynthesis